MLWLGVSAPIKNQTRSQWWKGVSMNKNKSWVALIIVVLLLGVGPIVGGISLVTSPAASSVTCNGVVMEPSDRCDVTDQSTGRSTNKSYDEMKAMNGPKKPWGIALIVFGAIVVIIGTWSARNRIRQH